MLTASQPVSQPASQPVSEHIVHKITLDFFLREKQTCREEERACERERKCKNGNLIMHINKYVCAHVESEEEEAEVSPFFYENTQRVHFPTINKMKKKIYFSKKLLHWWILKIECSLTQFQLLVWRARVHSHLRTHSRHVNPSDNLVLQ